MDRFQMTREEAAKVCATAPPRLSSARRPSKLHFCSCPGPSGEYGLAISVFESAHGDVIRHLMHRGSSDGAQMNVSPAAPHAVQCQNLPLESGELVHHRGSGRCTTGI